MEAYSEILRSLHDIYNYFPQIFSIFFSSLKPPPTSFFPPFTILYGAGYKESCRINACRCMDICPINTTIKNGEGLSRSLEKSLTACTSFGCRSPTFGLATTLSSKHSWEPPLSTASSSSRQEYLLV